MDKQSIIGFVLIAILFVVWMMYTGTQTADKPERAAEKAIDTTTKVDREISERKEQPELKTLAEKDSSSVSGLDMMYGRWFSKFGAGKERRFTIETDLLTAEFSSRGGGIKRWTLKNYSTWNKDPLQLIDWSIPSELNLFFITRDGKDIKTENLFFDFPELDELHRQAVRDTIRLKDSSSISFMAVLGIAGDSAVLAKRFTMYGNRYTVDVDVVMKNMGEIIANNEYQVTIGSPALTELNTVDEATFAEANAQVGSSRKTLDVSGMGDKDQLTENGETHWVSAQNKYFISALIARNGFKGIGAYIEGVHVPLPFEGAREIYLAGIKVRFGETSLEKSQFSLFIGPMQYDLLNAQYEGLEQVITLGWAFVVRPFSEYLIIPLFKFLNSFIPNYGIVILIFTLIIKLLLYPLTKTSMKSMQKMQALQPLMTELREKYKDDQQKQNAEMMKLYRDYGINPAGGCLPMLLQMPILFALFTIFRSTIELRQMPFMLWITDLSSPDILFRLPFKIPILGTDFISILALLMSITMFIQQKQTIKDPRQKAMVYIMPVMFWVMFNSFPSGLNLYYFAFNLLSILQQWNTTRKAGEFKLEKVPQKQRKGWMEKTMASLEQKAKDQQKKTRRK